MSDLGEKLKFYRKKKGLSQRKLAKLADLSNDYISKIELGRVENVGLVTLRKIAQVVDVSMSEIQSETSTRWLTNSHKGSLRIKEETAKYGLHLDKPARDFMQLWAMLSPSDKKVLIDLAKKLAKK